MDFSLEKLIDKVISGSKAGIVGTSHPHDDVSGLVSRLGVSQEMALIALGATQQNVEAAEKLLLSSFDTVDFSRKPMAHLYCTKCGQEHLTQQSLNRHQRTCKQASTIEESKDMTSAQKEVSASDDPINCANLPLGLENAHSTAEATNEHQQPVFSPCSYCKRTFNPTRITKHEHVCLERPKASPSSPLHTKARIAALGHGVRSNAILTFSPLPRCKKNAVNINPTLSPEASTSTCGGPAFPRPMNIERMLELARPLDRRQKNEDSHTVLSRKPTNPRTNPKNKREKNPDIEYFVAISRGHHQSTPSSSSFQALSEYHKASSSAAACGDYFQPMGAQSSTSTRSTRSTHASSTSSSCSSLKRGIPQASNKINPRHHIDEAFRLATALMKGSGVGRRYKGPQHPLQHRHSMIGPVPRRMTIGMMDHAEIITTPRPNPQMHADVISELQGKGLLVKASLDDLDEGVRAQIIMSPYVDPKAVSVWAVGDVGAELYDALLAKMTKDRSLSSDKFTPPEERHLFHGTRVQSLTSILTKGFNRGYASERSHRMRLGIANYFSPSFKFSLRYCDRNAETKVMIVAKVITGKSTVGNESQKQPPEGFDSTTEREENPRIYAVFHDFQSIPLFVLEFAS